MKNGIADHTQRADDIDPPKVVTEILKSDSGVLKQTLDFKNIGDDNKSSPRTGKNNTTAF